MPGKKIFFLLFMNYEFWSLWLARIFYMSVIGFFQACQFASEPALKSVHLFGQSYDHKTLVENKTSLVDGSMVRATSQQDFFVGHTFEKTLTFSLNILCIIHASIHTDFSAGCYYFINTVLSQLQTIELHWYLALKGLKCLWTSGFCSDHLLPDSGFVCCGLSPWFYL